MRKKTASTLRIIAAVVSVPLLVFEYFAFLWYWSGDGIFMLLAVPTAFALYLLLQIWLSKRFCRSKISKILMRYSMAFITPVFAVATALLTAKICGIAVDIA